MQRERLRPESYSVSASSLLLEGRASHGNREQAWHQPGAEEGLSELHSGLRAVWVCLAGMCWGLAN